MCDTHKVSRNLGKQFEIYALEYGMWMWKMNVLGWYGLERNEGCGGMQRIWRISIKSRRKAHQHQMIDAMMKQATQWTNIAEQIKLLKIFCFW